MNHHWCSLLKYCPLAVPVILYFDLKFTVKNYMAGIMTPQECRMLLNNEYCHANSHQ